MSIEAQHAAIYDKTVKTLIKQHKGLKDEPLVLALRLTAKNPMDIDLLEVIENFPGDDDDPPFCTEFPPSPTVRVLGNLILRLVSPSQFRYLIRNNKGFRARVRGAVPVETTKQGEKLLKLVSA
jgi:hypothetical protein